MFFKLLFFNIIFKEIILKKMFKTKVNLIKKYFFFGNLNIIGLLIQLETYKVFWDVLSLGIETGTG